MNAAQHTTQDNAHVRRNNVDVTVAQLAGFDEVIDVRSESEFADDHIPGAINCPVLNDAERAQIGTRYKQVSAFDAKKLGAALVSVNIARHLRERLRHLPGKVELHQQPQRRQPRLRADVERRLARILDARRDLGRAQAIYTVLGDTAGATAARRVLTEVTTNYPDDYEAKREEIRAAMLIADQGDEVLTVAEHQMELAALEVNAGNPEPARAAFKEALAKYRAGRDVIGQILAIVGLADFERSIERPEAADRKSTRLNSSHT